MIQQELSLLLNKYHLRPDKKLGQHYLIDETVLEKIIEAADIKKDELIVEVGGGPGVLTKALALAGAEVLTIEYAREFCRVLGEEYNNWRNVHVLCDDALRVDFSNLRKDSRVGAATGLPAENDEEEVISTAQGRRNPVPNEISHSVRDDGSGGSEGEMTDPRSEAATGLSVKDDSKSEEGVYRKMVANIPYQITNPLIRKILAPDSTIEVAVLMIQKEVADRLLAPAGSATRGLLTVLVEYYGAIERIVDVPPKAFWPAPVVDSSVIRLTKQTDPEKRLLAASQEKGFFWFVKQGFSGKRKMLPNSLSGGLQLSKNKTLTIVEGAGISPDIRAEDLTIEQWVALFNSYSHTFLNKP